MTPYYDDGNGITIYHGDANDVLPSLATSSIDLILTDPPYNVSERNPRQNTTPGRLKRKDGTVRKVWRDFGDWDYGWDPAKFLEESERLLVHGGGLISFTSEFLIQRFLETNLNHRCLIYWRKSNPTPAFRQLYVRAIEMAIWQVKGRSGWTFNEGGYRPNVFEGPSVSGHSCVNNDEPRIHPTQKPLWLMKTLVGLHSRPDDLILDPYIGSGTTLVSAKQMGRRCIGIELSEAYCQAAVRRLQQAVLPLETL